MLIEFAMVLAIQTQTTTCQTNFGITTCNTFQPLQPPPVQGPDPDAFNRGLLNGMAMAPRRAAVPADAMRCAGGDWFLAGCTLGAHREAVRLRDANNNRQAAQDRAMGLLRAGDCAGATAAALDTGDLDFATQVRAFCAAGNAAPQ